MKDKFRRFQVVAAILFALVALLVLTASATTNAMAKHVDVTYPPEDCSNCPPPYIGPNGGTCQPLGCVRPSGTCVLGGDC